MPLASCKLQKWYLLLVWHNVIYVSRWRYNVSDYWSVLYLYMSTLFHQSIRGLCQQPHSKRGEVNLLKIFHQATAINACNDLNYIMTCHANRVLVKIRRIRCAIRSFRSGPPVDGPKDPWPRVLSLPGRFIGDPASLACDNMYFTGITLHNIMQYVHQWFPCKHAPNIYRANLSSTAPSSHLGEQMLDEQWVLDYHARCLRRAPKTFFALTL